MLSLVKFYSSLKRNLVRSLLTLLQLSLGVGIAILVINLSFNLKRVASEGLNDYSGDFGIFYVQKSQSAFMPISSVPHRAVAQPSLIEVVKDDPSIKGITGLIYSTKQITASGRTYITTAYRADHTLIDVIPLYMLQGSFISKEDENKHVAVISESYARNLFGRTNVVGQKIKSQRFVPSVMAYTTGAQHMVTEFVIIGVYKDLPYLAREVLGKIHFIHSNEVDSASILTLPTIYLRAEKDRLQEAQTLLTQKAKELNGNDTNVIAANIDSYKNMGLQDLDSLENSLTLIALAAVIVSSIGILSVMISAVSEKNRDIGVKRALGATKTDIFIDILSETFALTLIGALIGIFFASLLAPLVYTEMISSVNQLRDFQFTDFYLLPSSVVCVVLVTSILGLFFGVYPAKLAADVPPAEALRE